MRHLKMITALCLCAVALLAGCTKYGTAVSTITPVKYENKQLTVTALVNDNGGCDYYMEQGFCYSLFSPPTLTDVTSTQVKVCNYSEVDTFSATFTLPLVDTAYYVCAYVKNSAGLSYSNIIRVSTNPLDYPPSK